MNDLHSILGKILESCMSSVESVDAADKDRLIDLVFESREKNFSYYQLNTSVLEEIMRWISELKGGNGDAEGK